jgi:hypothetical protein
MCIVKVAFDSAVQWLQQDPCEVNLKTVYEYLFSPSRPWWSLKMLRMAKSQYKGVVICLGLLMVMYFKGKESCISTRIVQRGLHVACSQLR